LFKYIFTDDEQVPQEKTLFQPYALANEEQHSRPVYTGLVYVVASSVETSAGLVYVVASFIETSAGLVYVVASIDAEFGDKKNIRYE
jgi:hypothetical protein